MIPAIITFSATGADLALRIATATGGRVHHCGVNGESPQALLPRLKAVASGLKRVVEIIVVDDGSTDETRAVCAAHGVRTI